MNCDAVARRLATPSDGDVKPTRLAVPLTPNSPAAGGVEPPRPLLRMSVRLRYSASHSAPALMPRIRLPRILHFLLVAAFGTGAAGLAAQATPKQQSSRATNHALDRANLDTACAPCDDFYTFAHGGRRKTAQLPPAQ